MVGLYRHEKDSHLPTFVIITSPAAPELAFIHDRMPLLVSGARQQVKYLMQLKWHLVRSTTKISQQN